MASNSHQAVIDGLTALYQTLIDLQYLPPNLVSHPPYADAEETVNTETAADVGFNQDVIDLMQKLPYITGDSDDWYVAPNTHPVCYLKEWRVDDGRDPLGTGRRDLPAHAVALTWAEGYGTFLIYDTKTGNITDWNPELDADSASPTPKGYTHLPTVPAADLLKRYTENFRSLKWLALSTGIVVVDNEEHKSVYDDLKKVYTECGWPGKLDVEAFAAKKKTWEEGTLGEYKKQMEEERKRVMEEEADKDEE